MIFGQLHVTSMIEKVIVQQPEPRYVCCLTSQLYLRGRVVNLRITDLQFKEKMVINTVVDDQFIII